MRTYSHNRNTIHTPAATAKSLNHERTTSLAIEEGRHTNHNNNQVKHLRRPQAQERKIAHAANHRARNVHAAISEPSSTRGQNNVDTFPLLYWSKH